MVTGKRVLFVIRGKKGKSMPVRRNTIGAFALSDCSMTRSQCTNWCIGKRSSKAITEKGTGQRVLCRPLIPKMTTTAGIIDDPRLPLDYPSICSGRRFINVIISRI